MDEWAKVVVYPLGLVGFALLLLYRVHTAAEKRREQGKEPKPALVLTSLAAVSLVSGLILAFLQIANPKTDTSASRNEPQEPRTRREQPMQRDLEEEDRPSAPARRDIAQPASLAIPEETATLSSFGNLRFRMPEDWTRHRIPNLFVETIALVPPGYPAPPMMRVGISMVSAPAVADLATTMNLYLVGMNSVSSNGWRRIGSDQPGVECMTTAGQAQLDWFRQAHYVVVGCSSPGHIDTMNLLGESEQMINQYLPAFNNFLAKVSFASAASQ